MNTLEEQAMLDSSFRIVLTRLSQTREPALPDPADRPLYDQMFARRYLAYVYGAHTEGFVITGDGRDLVSPHRQGAMR
jgi:hypothetical protein